MPKYYLHHIYDEPPILIHTDLVLDLRPGSMIRHERNFYVIQDDAPIQYPYRDEVHLSVSLAESISGPKADTTWDLLMDGWWPDQRR